MKKRKVKMLALVLAAAAMMTACGQNAGKESSVSGDITKSSQTAEESTQPSKNQETDKGKLPTLTLYPANATLTSGLVTGNRADYFAENGFQMEVWAFSDEKINAILTSGDLPDIMYVEKDKLDTLIEAGMILNLEDYLDKMPHLHDSKYIDGALDMMRKNNSAGTGELYAFPTDVSGTEVPWNRQDSTDRNSVKLRWDVYEEIGAPEIKDYWELIDVCEQMVKAHPQEEDGTKCYGMFLDNGLDSSYWGGMTLWFRWHGYTENYLPFMMETNMVTGEFNSILRDDSLYHEGLKWYNEVYRRGLMDPESINTDRGTQAKKVDAGLAMVPGGTLPGWATKYYEYYIPGSVVYYNRIKPYGNPTWSIVVNANTEHLDECLAFLDMLCSGDAYLRMQFGPDGDIWYSDGENAYPTEAYLNWFKEGHGSTNSFPMSDGTEWSWWAPLPNSGGYSSFKDVNVNLRSGDPSYWDEVQDITCASDNFEKWKKTTGYNTWRELLEDKDAYVGSSPVDAYSTYLTAASDSMQLKIDSLKDIVVTASWKMVYAETEEEFDAIWKQMLSDCEGLEAQKVIDWKLEDIENAKKEANVK